jgi:hypothetical protein
VFQKGNRDIEINRGETMKYLRIPRWFNGVSAVNRLGYRNPNTLRPTHFKKMKFAAPVL